MLSASQSHPASPKSGLAARGRTSSRGSLRRSLSKPPSLSTVWEWDGRDLVDSVPSTDDVMTELTPTADDPMRGLLAVRSGFPWLGFLGRRAWASRYAVLQPATSSAPPRLLLYQSGAMDELHEELLLLAPLELECLPADTTAEPSRSRFTLSSGGCSPIELSAPSDDQRMRWIYFLGESMLPPSPAPPSPPLGAPSSATGRVQLLSGRVSDHYRMGKLLVETEDYLIIEGHNLQTGQSHSLKLLHKHSSSFKLGRDGLQARACSRLLGQCLEELYEGPNHVCIVMRWGAHELDDQHLLAAAVLEALRLLREVTPEAELPKDGLMLQRADAHRLLGRAVALDSHLRSNLFI